MRPIAASILVFEAIIVVMAIPVAISLGGVDATAAAIAGGALALGCLLTAGLLGRPGGYAAGWVIQGLLIASGVAVTAMFFLGGLFALLWFVGLRVGRRGEALRAERWANADDPSSGEAPTAG